MDLLKKPERWMCLPTAFAMALGMPLRDVLDLIGHDGSEIVWPNYPEPQCRRGFHTQELIDVAVRAGYAVTPIQLFPALAPSERAQPLAITWGSQQGNWARFRLAIRRGRGVITGRDQRHGKGHAVAYDHGAICDPDGEVYRYSRRECEQRGFIVDCAWRIDRVRKRHGDV